MAIIYSYPVVSTVNNSDTLVISVSDTTADNGFLTKSLTADTLATYVTARVNLNFLGDTGTGVVNLDTQNLSITGTANEIETAASSQTLQIGLPDNVTITNNLTVGNNLSVSANATVGTDLTVGNDVQVDNDVNVDGEVQTNTLVVSSTSEMQGSLSMTLNNINNVANPVSAQDAATKAYVDGLISGGLSFRGSFRADTGEILSGANTGSYLYNCPGGAGTRVAVLTGDYYIVANAGGQFYCSGDLLNVGDSIIAVADAAADSSTINDWSTLESDNIEGTGLTNTIPVWTDSQELGNSMISQDAGATLATISGDATFTGSGTFGGNGTFAGSVSIDDYIIHNGDTDSKFGFVSNDTFVVNTNNLTRLRVASGGNVGIGVTSPAVKLDVQSSGQEVASFKSENTLKGGITFENSEVSNNKAHLFIRTPGNGEGRICLGHSDDFESFDNLKIEKKPSNTYPDANMGFGGDGVGDHNKFRLRWRHDTADVTDAYNGYSSNGTVTGSTALTSDRTVSGVNAIIDSTASGGNQTDELRLKGVNADVHNQVTGDANHVYGVFASAKNSKTAAGSNQTDLTGGFLRAYNAASTGTVDTMYGVNGIALVESTGGNIGNAHGVNGRVTIDSTANSPITEKAVGGYFVTQLESSNNNLVAEVNGVFAKNTVASTITDVKGLEVVNDVDAGTVTNAYLIKGDVQKAGGANITNNFGIYLNGVSKNFLDGQVGVNRVPSAQLDVKNQTANTNAFRVLSSNNVASLILKEDSSSNAELTLRDGLGNTNVKLDTAGNCFLIGSTKLGIGTDAPLSKLSVAGGDIEVQTIASGLILKSPNGTRYRITVDNAGNLSTSAV